jgi:hypothetical protein
MGANTHPTTTPKQAQTDTYAVFADNPQDPHPNLTLIKRVEVPRYTTRDEDGVEMGPDKRLQLAVQWAVTAEDSAAPPEMVEGQEFMVMHDLEAPMAFVEFQRNPAVAGVWNPNKDEA